MEPKLFLLFFRDCEHLFSNEKTSGPLKKFTTLRKAIEIPTHEFRFFDRSGSERDYQALLHKLNITPPTQVIQNNFEPNEAIAFVSATRSLQNLQFQSHHPIDIFIVHSSLMRQTTSTEAIFLHAGVLVNAHFDMFPNKTLYLF